MIRRDKLFLIADNVDDSIKSVTNVYDITIFRTFTEFEKYVDENPVIIAMLVITTNELQFTSSNMQRLINVTESPFLQITENVIYLIDETHEVRRVSEFLSQRGITEWAVYQGDLSSAYIGSIISGEGRENVEGQIELVTYRVKASEYIKQKEELKYDDDKHYIVDDEELQDLPIEIEPVSISPERAEVASIDYVAGLDSTARTLFAVVLAQYRALSGKTLIVESDVEYHTLLELFTKAGIDYELVLVQEVYADVAAAMDRIRNTEKKLVIVATVKRVAYDYEFFFNLLYNNLSTDVRFFVRECKLSQVPYGRKCMIVTENVIPTVLRTCNELRSNVEAEDIVFIGVQLSNLGPVNITSQELQAVVSQVIGKSRINAQVVKSEGVTLKGKEVVYDILGVIKGRG